MSLTVVFRETALRSLARIRNDDKDLFARVSTGCTPAASGSCTKSMMTQGRFRIINVGIVS